MGGPVTPATEAELTVMPTQLVMVSRIKLGISVSYGCTYKNADTAAVAVHANTSR
jgi:hypothetical protein